MAGLLKTIGKLVKGRPNPQLEKFESTLDSSYDVKDLTKDIAVVGIITAVDQVKAFANKIDEEVSLEFINKVVVEAPESMQDIQMPVDTTTISSGYGKRVHPVTHEVKQHRGVDFPVAVGTPVYAIADGEVTKMSWDDTGGGNRIWLKHDDGVETVYMHLDSFAPNLTVGSHVTKGTVIAYSGTSGISTGPHLHFGVKYQGDYVNPEEFFNLQQRLANPLQEPTKEIYSNIEDTKIINSYGSGVNNRL